MAITGFETVLVRLIGKGVDIPCVMVEGIENGSFGEYRLATEVVVDLPFQEGDKVSMNVMIKNCTFIYEEVTIIGILKTEEWTEFMVRFRRDLTLWGIGDR